MKICLVIPILVLITLNLFGQVDTSYNYHKPLFDFRYENPTFKLVGEQLKNKNRFFRASILTGYREGVKPISADMLNFDAFTDSISGTRRIVMFNLSIEEMLVHNTSWFPQNKVILEVKDPSRYRYDPKYGSKENWMRKNTYCYEFIMPNGVMRTDVPNTLMGMQFEEDLQYLFGVQIIREKRKIKSNSSEETEQDIIVIKETSK